MSRKWKPGQDAMSDVLRALDPNAEGLDMVRARLLDAADRMASPAHKGNQHRWLEHARMFRDLAAALNPTPPKPDEPTGLGAVVEDEDGVTWVRAGKTHGGRMHDHWRCVDGEHVGYWAKWDRLTAVRVLSEGVR